MTGLFKEKTRHIKEIVLWTTLFLVMVVAPLCLALVGHTKVYHGFWIEFGVALGFIAIALMGLQFVLTARFKNIAVSFGTDALLQFHRQAGYVAYGFVLGHVLVLIAANSGYLSFFDPRINAPRAMALSLVIVLITLLVILTISRRQFQIAYEWWRLSHGIFAFLILMIGLAHILMVAFYVSALWKQLLWIGMTGTAMFMLVHVRLVNPYKMSKNRTK
ncbi:MAG: ferric reductase-like transmembrane domain-containing protein [Balneolaceae bacterium]